MALKVIVSNRSPSSSEPTKQVTMRSCGAEASPSLKVAEATLVESRDQGPSTTRGTLPEKSIKRSEVNSPSESMTNHKWFHFVRSQHLVILLFSPPILFIQHDWVSTPE